MFKTELYSMKMDKKFYSHFFIGSVNYFHWKSEKFIIFIAYRMHAALNQF